MAIVAVGAGAQEPRGAGPDARTPPAGAIRFGVGFTWERNIEQYLGSGAGSLRELGARFSLDTLGSSVFAALGPVQAATATMAGMPGFRASLGRSTVHARNMFETTPLAAEIGVTSHFSVGVMVPLVTTTSRVDVVVNPHGNEATVGLNPAYFAPSVISANGELLAQFDSAAALLSRRITTCGAQPSATGCAGVNANIAAAQALIQQSSAFAAAMATLYGGRDGSRGALFVPVAGTAAQAAIGARIQGFKAQYAALGGAISGAPPVGAPGPVTAAGFQAILTDSAYGIIASPLGSVVRRGVGNIDVSAQFTWHDSYTRSASPGSMVKRFWWRSAIAGTYRLGTGAPPKPEDLIPMGTGDHQRDVEVRSITDLGIGTTASVTTVLRHTMQAEGTLRMRIAASPTDPFPEAFRTALVTRDPGDETAVDVYPRWNLSRAMSVAGHYGYRSRSADAYRGSVTGTDPAGATVTADASALDEGTAAHEHRVGAVVAYSTVSAWNAGKARWPIELSISHFQTISASGGTVPKLAYDEVQIRWFWHPFGR